MQAVRLNTRLQRELRMLQTDPPPGVCAWPCKDSISHLEAQIEGPDETVYAKGIFRLEVRIPERYPFEPPNVRFITPLYHPNIDSGGRICLDILNMPPKGAWKPSLNIPTILASIGLLLAEPNADDGLMGDITEEYKHNRGSFDAKARKWTQQYAVQAASDDRARADGGDSPIKTTESTPSAGTANHISIAEGIFENVRDEAREASLSTVERTPAKTSSSHKLNLSMRLSRDKGPKGLERPNTTATESSAGNSSFDSATRPSSAQQLQATSLNGQSSLETAPASGQNLLASSSKDPFGQSSALKPTTERSCHTPAIHERLPPRPVPFRVNGKPISTASLDMRKFKRPKDVTPTMVPVQTPTKAEQQEIRVNASSTNALQTFPGNSDSKGAHPVCGNEGQNASQPASDGLARVKNSKEAAKEATKSSIKSSNCFGNPQHGSQHRAVRMDSSTPESLETTRNPPKALGNENVVLGIQVEGNHKALENSSKRDRDTTCIPSSGPLEDEVSRRIAKRSRRSETVCMTPMDLGLFDCIVEECYKISPDMLTSDTGTIDSGDRETDIFPTPNNAWCTEMTTLTESSGREHLKAGVNSTKTEIDAPRTVDQKASTKRVRGAEVNGSPLNETSTSRPIPPKQGATLGHLGGGLSKTKLHSTKALQQSPEIVHRKAMSLHRVRGAEANGSSCHDESSSASTLKLGFPSAAAEGHRIPTNVTSPKASHRPPGTFNQKAVSRNSPRGGEANGSSLHDTASFVSTPKQAANLEQLGREQPMTTANSNASHKPLEKVNQKAVSMNRVSGAEAQGPSSQEKSSSFATLKQVGTLGQPGQGHPLRSLKSTKASQQSPEIVNQKATSMNRVGGAEANGSTPRESGWGSAATTLNSTQGISKGLAHEGAKGAVLKPVNTVERTSTGTMKNAEGSKKSGEYSSPVLIVLDSESDEEPPRGRSRLSLSKMKGVKRK